MKTNLAWLFLLLTIPAAALASDEAAPATPPAWFLEEIATLTANGGRWVTDNSAYKNENEPFEAYGMVWSSSFDGVTMTGRLFGIKDGVETGNFWEFRQYWHPQERRAVLEQFGWGGVVGIGTSWREGETTKSRQTFYAPDGTASETGHASSFPDATTHITESFDIVDDTWSPRRKYVWQLMPANDS